MNKTTICTNDLRPTEVAAKVREFAALAPDFVYDDQGGSACVYYPTYGNPLGCIVGAAFADLGVDTLNMPIDSIDSIAMDFRDEADDHALDWLIDVQSYQDLAKPWGVAVLFADDEAEADGREW